jgi:survival-of-motor-neuron-related-splicing factor 30
MAESATIEDLEKTLATYQEQFEQVEAALKQMPTSEELLKVKEDLVEVINLTNNLLRLKSKTIGAAAAPATVPTSTKVTNVVAKKQAQTEESSFKVGDYCRAIWPEDGNWYDAVIDSAPTADNDKYQVTYVDYGNSSLVSLDQLAPQDTAKQNKRAHEAVEEENEDSLKEFEIPKSLKILPTDSESVRNMKRKKIKAIKSQFRQKKQEAERSNKKSAWQMFTSSGSSTKGPSSLSKSKGSIFRSPDSVEGRVGVTGMSSSNWFNLIIILSGSGKPLTPNPTFKATEVKVKKDVKLPLL